MLLSLYSGRNKQVQHSNMGLTSLSEGLDIKSLLSKLSFEFVNYDLLLENTQHIVLQYPNSKKVFFDSNFLLYALMNLLSVRNADVFKRATTFTPEILEKINCIDCTVEVDIDLTKSNDYIIHNGKRHQQLANIIISEDEYNFYAKNPNNYIRIHDIVYFLSEDAKRNAHVNSLVRVFQDAGEGKNDLMYQKLLNTIETYVNCSKLEYRIYNARLIYRDCCFFLKKFIDKLTSENGKLIAVNNNSILYEVDCT